jgi:hypothetical protein
MANPYVPTNVRLKDFFGDRVLLDWDFPNPEFEQLYTFRIYASDEYINPVVPVPATPYTNLLKEYPRSSAYLDGVTNVYVAISSVNLETAEESLQSAPLFLSFDHSADSQMGGVAKSPLGIPKYIHTDEQGKITISTAGGAGLATEPKQDDMIDLLDDIRDNTAIDVPSDPFNDFWLEPVVLPDTWTEVYNISVNVGDPIYYVTGLCISSQDCSIILLKRSGSIVWKGRIGAVNYNINPRFTHGPIKIVPGQDLTLEVYQNNKKGLNVEFSGNVFGYRRAP